MKKADRNFETGREKPDCRKAAGRIFFGILSVFLCFCVAGRGRQALAASATVSVTTKNTAVTKGDVVYVVITVRATENIDSFEAYFSYDNRVLQFVTGGSLVHGNDDRFRIQDTERKSSTDTITYSVKFLARKQGSTEISMKKPYSIRAGDDTASKMSVSYNTLNILVNRKQKTEPAKKTEPPLQKEKTETPEETAAPKETAVPKEKPEKKDIPGSNKLRSLQIRDAEFAPEFAPKIQKYSVLATTSKKKLDITWETQDSRAKVVVKGNKGLTEGKNIIKIAVTGRDGKKRVYRLSVTVQKEEEIEEKSNLKENADEQGVQEEQLRMEAQKRKNQSMKYMMGIVASFCGLLLIFTIAVVMKRKRGRG